jgi:hypothetical protein
MAKRFTYYSNEASTPAGLWTLVSRTSFGSASGGTTPSINTTTANLIVAEVSSYYPVGEPVLSDSKGNTWIALTRHYDLGLISSNRLYYCINPTVGSGHTFTLTGSFVSFNVTAFNNTITPTYLAENGNADLGINAYIDCGSLTNTLSNALFICSMSNLNSGTPPITLNSGYTQLDSFYNTTAAYISSSAGYKIVNGIVTLNPRFSYTNANYQSASHAVFQ